MTEYRSTMAVELPVKCEYVLTNGDLTLTGVKLGGFSLECFDQKVRDEVVKHLSIMCRDHSFRIEAEDPLKGAP